MASLTRSQRLLIASLTATLLPNYLNCNAFVPPSLSQLQRPSLLISFRVTSQIPTHLHVTNQSPDAPKTAEEDAALQWDLFTRHHAVDGEWWGSWNTYDYMGDVVDSTVAGLVFILIMISLSSNFSISHLSTLQKLAVCLFSPAEIILQSPTRIASYPHPLNRIATHASLPPNSPLFQLRHTTNQTWEDGTGAPP